MRVLSRLGTRHKPAINETEVLAMEDLPKQNKTNNHNLSGATSTAATTINKQAQCLDLTRYLLEKRYV